MSCSVFRYMEGLIDPKNPDKNAYRLPNHKDVFSSLKKGDYDNALTRVRPPINNVIVKLYKGDLSIEPADYISEGTTDECPESRRYELEIFDDKENLQYGLIYQEGKILRIIGNVPADEIASILRMEGAWEGIPESVKDLYRRLKKRIKDENKKIAGWEKERDDIRKKKELSTEDIKKMRDLINRIERSYRIIREDENRIKELGAQFPGIEKMVR